VIDAPTDRVAAEWGRRVGAEYRSAAIAQQLTLWLIEIGASPDLIESGLRIVRDELAHAAQAFDVLHAAGGDGPAALDRSELRLAERDASERDLDVIDATIRVFCLGETVAVPLFRNLRAGCTVPVARAALDRVLRDEPRHRRFGWVLLEWLLDQPDEAGASARARVDAILPEAIEGLRQVYGPPADHAVAILPTVTEGERAWGLAPAGEYATVLEAAIDGDLRRRFATHGFALPDPPAARP
jgi:1,2-phenylacetyl-CoA epoxidase catalytic subunit